MPDTSPNPQRTEIVYVCTPDWQHELFTSMRSLFASGTHFDRLVIYCVGERPGLWEFTDPRILVVEVPRLTQGYFMDNKTYLTGSNAERVIYLDADTLVIRPLDGLYCGIDADFIARPASAFRAPDWDQWRWEELLAEVDAPTDSPYFNAGFVIFQNHSAARLHGEWLALTRRLMNGEIESPKPIKFAEQLALALTVAAAGLSVHLLDRHQHAFGWRREPFHDTVLFHAGTGYFRFAHEIEGALGLCRLDLPRLRRPAFVNPIWWQRRLRRLKGRLGLL